MRFRTVAVLAALAWLLACVATANAEPNPEGHIGVPGSDPSAAWEPSAAARLLAPIAARGDAGAGPMRTAGPQSFGADFAQSCCEARRQGEACGNSCIGRSKTCTKPPGCACDAH